MKRLSLIGLVLILAAGSSLVAAQSDSPAFRLTQQIGRGHIQSLAWHPTDDVILVSTIRGAWFYDGTSLRDRGHIEDARLAAFSPDGDLVAGVNAENQITLWDSVTYESIATLTGHDSFVSAMVWSSDGTQLASADESKHLLIWDIEQHRTRSTWTIPGTAAAMRWSPDDSKLAVVMQDTTLYVFDAVLKQQIFYAEPATCCDQPSLDVAWIDNQTVVRGVIDSGVTGSQFEQWNIDTSALTGQYWPNINMNLSPSLAFSPDGTLYALSTNEHGIILDTETQTQIYEFEKDIRWFFNHFAWNGGGTKLAGVDAFDRLYVWDITLFQRLALNLDHAQPTPRPVSGSSQWIGEPNVKNLPSWSLDSRYLAVPSHYSSLSLWDASSWNRIAIIGGTDGSVIKAVWNAKNNWLATLQDCNYWGKDTYIRVWDGQTGRLIDSYTLGVCPTSLAWRPGDNILLSVNEQDGQVHVWNGEFRQQMQPLTLLPYDPYINSLTSVSWSPDGSHVVISYWGGSIGPTELFDYPELTRTACLEACYVKNGGHSYFIYQTYWSADSTQWFQVAWYSHYARGFVDYAEGDPFRADISLLFDTQSDALYTVSLHGHTAPIVDMAADPSGTNLITISEDDEARLWDVSTGENLLTFPHTNQVAWSPDGTLIGGFNVVNRVWQLYDARSGVVVASLPIAATKQAGYLVWSPDSQKIAQVVDGVVFIWER